MGSIVARSGLIAIGAMLASVLIASAATAMQGETLHGTGLLLSVLCPIALAWPASAHSLWQKRRILESHAELARAHAELAQAHARLKERASRDPMTGLLNRESFFAALRAEIELGIEGMLLIIDADHFKRINDTFGHQTGDRALVEIALGIGRARGRGSVVGRIGGEEFAAFLPVTDAADGLEIAEKIRVEISGIAFAVADDRRLPLTVSIGAAMIGDDRSIAAAMRAADRWLYAAKHGGRNRVAAQDPRTQVAA